MTIRSFGLVSALALAALAGTAQAQYFGLGNLVVTRVGDGTTTLNNAAFGTSIVEFNRLGAATGNFINLNSGASGTRLTNSGTATSEGTLTGSSFDGRYLTNAGYDAAAGTAAVVGSANPNTARVVAVTDTWTGTVSYSAFSSATAANSAYSANNIRGAILAADGSIYMTGTSAVNGGVRTGAASGGSSSSVSGGATNVRVVNQFNFGPGAQPILFSSASGTGSPNPFGINVLTGAGTYANIVSDAVLRNGGTASSAYDFWMPNDRTLYVADDRTSSTGGLIKLVRTGGVAGDLTTGAWSFVYSILLPTATAANAGLRGLAGEVVGGNVNLFAISTDNRIVSYSEPIGAVTASSFTTLATAGANFAFRGIEIVPTPGAAALLGLGGLLVARRRRA